MAVTALLIIGVTNTQAKQKTKSQSVYIFGFAASFNDSTVYFTDPQRLDSVRLTKKTQLLKARSEYSAQLRDYMTTKLNQKHRTCIVVYSQKQKKLEKKYLKMKRLYTKKTSRGYDVRYITRDMFEFTTVKIEEEEQTANGK